MPVRSHDGFDGVSAHEHDLDARLPAVRPFHLRVRPRGDGAVRKLVLLDQLLQVVVIGEQEVTDAGDRDPSFASSKVPRLRGCCPSSLEVGQECFVELPPGLDEEDALAGRPKIRKHALVELLFLRRRRCFRQQVPKALSATVHQPFAVGEWCRYWRHGQKIVRWATTL